MSNTSNSSPLIRYSAIKTIFTYILICALSFTAAIIFVIAYDARQHPISWVAATQYLSGQSIFIPDSELGFLVRPNLNAKAERSELSYFTNARSARVAVPGTPLPLKVDFLSVGCSQTLGDGVSSEDTFTGVLAKVTGLTGINFGMSGYGGTGSLLLIRRTLDLKPKYIIYGFWEDHLNRNVKPCLESGMPFCTPRPIVAFDTSQQPYIKFPEDPSMALERARKWYGNGTSPFLKDFTAATFRSWDTLKARFWGAQDGTQISKSEKIKATHYVLKEMKVAADSIGAKLIVVYIPLYFTDITDVDSDIASFALANGIELVDLAPHLRDMKRRGEIISIPDNGHISKAVHRAIAEQIKSTF